MSRPVSSPSPHRRGPWPRIIGGLCLLATLALLQACSTVSLGYNRAQGLAHWWLDSQVDLTEAQSALVRTELAQLHRWHRREALPRYAELLQRWQAMAPGELSAQQACAEYARARDLLLEGLPRVVPGLARLAQRLGPEQLAHLQRQHAKANQGFHDDYLARPAKALERRAKRLRERLEMFYGPLDTQQQRLIRERLAQGSFDAARLLEERERQQADMLQTAAAIRSQPDAAAQGLVQAALGRMLESPSETYRAQARAWTQETCEVVALVHQRSNPQQRQAAAQALRDHADELLRLAQQD